MPSSDQAAVPQDVVIHYDVPCTLSDGTVLRADVARPAGEGRWPVILARTPYGKAVAPGFTTDLTHGARHGYVTIIQDVRGRGTSDGKADFQPWVDEGRDGAEAVEWAAALPYSNGRVYMSGPSYLGFVQWAAAAEQPPSLQAINPIVPVGHFNRSFIYCSGVFELELNGYWWTMLGVEELMRRDWDSPEARTEAIARSGASLEALARDGGYDHLPLNRFEPVKHSAQGAQLFALLEKGVDDPSMKASARANEYENITVPALIVAGWYDIFIRGSIDQFVGLRSRGHSDGARTKSRLIVGPWAHHPQSKMTGEQILPGSAAIQALNPFGHMGLAARYFSALNEGEEAAPVKIWIMGANRWRDEQEWPIARTVVTPWYLSSGGQANTSEGDGVLSPQQGSGGPPDAFVYDPANPVPTRGGAVFGVSCVPGGSDQNPIEKRDDILVYTSDILEEDIEVTGTPFVELWVKTDVVDTDFVARLVDVHPDGTARLITDGIIRARYRDDPDDLTRQAEPLEPGKPYLLRIELLPTSNLFKAGHRLQLDVTSSCFPRWARNLNIWDEWGGTLADAKVAHQQVLHDEAHPSRILLPIVPAAS